MTGTTGDGSTALAGAGVSEGSSSLVISTLHIFSQPHDGTSRNACKCSTYFTYFFFLPLGKRAYLVATNAGLLLLSNVSGVS